MDNGLEIIKRPLVSEKSTQQGELHNKVYFRVAKGATKPQIREAIEIFFKVTVKDVRTMVMPGKPYTFARSKGAQKSVNSNKPKWKKAIVTLKEGDKIEFIKGV